MVKNNLIAVKFDDEFTDSIKLNAQKLINAKKNVVLLYGLICFVQFVCPVKTICHRGIIISATLLGTGTLCRI